MVGKNFILKENLKRIHFKILKIQENYFGKDHFETAKTILNLGVVY